MKIKPFLLITILAISGCNDLFNPESKEEDPEGDGVFELVWENRTDPNHSVIGSNYQQIWGNYFICTGDIEDPPTIKAFNTSNGEKEWEYIHKGSLKYKIIFNKLKNNIYIGITNDGVFGFDLEDREMRWELNLSELDMRFGWGMTLHGDYIYMPASWMFKQINIEEERMLKIHYLTGEMETVFKLKSQDSLMYEFSAPVFWRNPETGHDIMYFNNQNWRQDLSPQQTAQDMWAVDVVTGEVLWSNLKFTPVASNGSIPPVRYDDAVITGGDWSIYSFDALTGELNWKREFDEHSPLPIWSKTQHLNLEDRIYVNNNVYDIYCLNAESGDLIWHNEKDAPNCSPTMTYFQDMLVYTSWGYGSIMVLDAYTGEKIHQEYSHNNSTFNADVIYDSKTDMFFTADYHYAYGFKIHKPE